MGDVRWPPRGIFAPSLMFVIAAMSVAAPSTKALGVAPSTTSLAVVRALIVPLASMTDPTLGHAPFWPRPQPSASGGRNRPDAPSARVGVP